MNSIKLINCKLAFFGCIIFLASFACKKTEKKAEYFHIAGTAQGCEYHITYENSINKDLSAPIDSILDTIDASLSIYNKKSVISRINGNDSSVKADAMMLEMFRQSLRMWRLSNGDFDITVGPLVRAWGFGPEARNVNHKQRIDSLLQYVGMYKLKVEGNKIIKKYPQMYIDVNAIAQGYSVDLVCNYFDSLGLKNYIVEIGGEVKAKGKNNKGLSWKVGIDKPLDNNTTEGSEIQAVILLDNMALATSGNYRKFYVEKGIKYSHTINPHTGYPARNTLLSATIIAKTCALADAYATACMVMGFDKAQKFIAAQKGISAYLIYSKSDSSLGEYTTEDLKGKILE